MNDQAKQQDLIFREIGAFVVEFGHLEKAMQQFITMYFCYLGVQENTYTQVVFADDAAGALEAKIRSIGGMMFNLKSTIINTNHLSDYHYEILNKILKNIKELIEFRNKVLHATHYVGWCHDASDDVSSFTSTRFKSGKNGVYLEEKMPKKAGDFVEKRVECEKTKNILQRLTMYFFPILVENYDIKKDQEIKEFMECLN